MTFGDLETLNVDQINAVSHKYGEETFNPSEIFDETDYSDEEILRKFNRNISKSKIKKKNLYSKKLSN